MSERLVVHLDCLEGHWLLPLLKGSCGVANGCFDVLHAGHLAILSHFHREYDPAAVVRWSGSEVVAAPMFRTWSTTHILEGKLEEDPGHR